MKSKNSYVDSQELADEYEVGDKVRFPIFTRGNTFAPHVGRVTAVLESIGQIDVETVFGNVRVSPEDIQKEGEFEDSDYLEDTSLDTWDRRKASKVASQYYNTRFQGLIKKASHLQDFDFTELEAYDFLFTRHSSTYSDAEIKRAVKTAFSNVRKEANSRTKEGLYWKAKGRRYVPNRNEIESGEFKCPRCKCVMEKAHYKKHTPLYACPDCLWLIRPGDLLDPSEDPPPLEEDQPDPVDFFEPSDPMLQEVYGDEDGDDE